MTKASTIHEACRAGDLPAVERLLAADPQLVDADDEHRWRPIFHAALAKRVGVVQHLLRAGADVAAHDGYVLHYAAEVPDNREVVSLLVQYGALDSHVLPTSERARQLLAAIYLGDAARVRSLLELHPPSATQIDGRGDLPIHHAARNGET
ncbi:MAG: ankyrin repeat domain-containing protein, partial [Planctomycetota bacterium]